VVRLLLEKGTDIDAKDGRGETALHQAAWNGHETPQLCVFSSLDQRGEPNGGNASHPFCLLLSRFADRVSQETDPKGTFSMDFPKERTTWTISRIARIGIMHIDWF
jgi:hypothetical protein